MPAPDFTQPWYAAWRGTGEAAAARCAAGQAMHDALNVATAAPVRFVPQEALPAGTPYEQFVFDTRQVPMRPGAHDFFNALVWLGLPRTKAALNRLQAQEIARLGIGAQRGPVRDAITVFDENGALLQAPAAIWQALQARAWRELFVELRPLWRQARLLVFGHALLEQLAFPRKGLTAHVWRADAAMDSLAQADAWLAGRCTAEALAGKPFTPLPVLGVPGWWPENENFSFYDDSLVFRPRRPTEPTTTASPGPSPP
ncbi:DUF3025 domain-containing protein [Ramlibacter sp. PS3R-8]|uniref:DUF3025 domain-containing protein n=1 Tax=Ramlibacter sp. PS3R-8 TaxID=3133437 RepID=UPI0030AA9082